MAGNNLPGHYDRPAKEKYGASALLVDGNGYLSPYNPDIVFDRSDPLNVVETHTVADPFNDGQTESFSRTITYDGNGDITAITKWSKV